jgi:hypothetical protein
MEFFADHKHIFVVLHALAAAGGLGAVLITDTLFFKFLKDFKISPKENEVLKTISGAVWVIIALLFLTGLALYLSAPMDYLTKAKFVTKLVIFGVIVANGFLLNWVITPFLTKISFGPVTVEPTKKLRIMRRVAFASGAVSMVSWLAVFILGSIRSIPINAAQGLMVYVGLIVVVVAGSQFYATWVKRHSIFGIHPHFRKD